VRILIVTAPQRTDEPCGSGQWAQRIATYLHSNAPPDWQLIDWPQWPAAARTGQGLNILTIMLDEPEDILPKDVPQAELLLVLTESAGMTDLVPDLAERCGAQAVIVPIDRRSWAPQGLIRQVRRRLEAMNVDSVWPMPFCTLAPNSGQHPLIQKFAREYGRPEFICEVRDNTLVSCQATRETPCGNTHYIVGQLAGVEVDKAVEQCGLFHHYYPCWGGMETDPVHNTHTLLHIAATIAQNAIKRALKDSEQNRSKDPKGKETR
jgi:hypothetical protein